MAVATQEPKRLTQPERRARSRGALLEAAARGLSRYGYSNLLLERVARDAGYTRGALYHQFASKEELTIAVLRWVEETWYEEVGKLAEAASDPAEALIALARGHAVYCRRDIARVMVVLRVEFNGQDHPVGSVLQQALERLLSYCTRLIVSARRKGSIPPGPPARVLALAYLGAMEGLVINLASQAPYDEMLVERAARGVLGLGLPPTTAS